jgi:WD40 repeat protein
MKAPRAQQGQQQQDAAAASQLGAQTDTDCLCVAFDPCHEHRLASGGADGYVYVLDSRRLDEPLQQLRLHAGSVTSVAWSPKRAGLLATAGEDGVVLLWDADKMQQPQPQQQPHDEHARLDVGSQVAMLGQRGLLWAHGGHLSPVSAVALNADSPWLVASASEREVAAPGSTGESVVVQRRHVMVWEVNRSGAAFR